MMPTTSEIGTEARFTPIILDSLRVDSVLDFDLFIAVNSAMVLYRSADLPFTDRTRQKLLENNVDRLYIATQSRAKYQKYIEANLPTILRDPQIRPDRKAGILYEASANLVKDVFSNPTVSENIRRSKNVVTSTVDYILQGQEAFHSLLKITSFDYYTYTHSVNVCTFSVALAQHLDLGDEGFLHELGVGALLHDVGKTRVSPHILNKRAALSPSEFEIMKQHPHWGVEILNETDEIAPGSYYQVLQHHERGGRRGYPNGLSLGDMHTYSRIVAVADCFDAMTTQRVYQKAVDSFSALRSMLSMRGAFDHKLLSGFVELMGPGGLARK